MPKNINYIAKGKGEVILFLHGWGQNITMMEPLIEDLKNNYKCVVLDLPGFGESCFNNTSNISAYTENIRMFLKEKNLLPKYIVGHSFGGKVALEYYLKYRDLSKLVIIASPLLKPKRNLVYYFKIYKYKLTKKIIKYNKEKIGSNDYKECSKEMKNFFISVVNEHYNNCIKQIDIPVLLLWGNKDRKVPVNKGKRLNKEIKNSELHIIRGDHFAYLENLMYTKLTLNKFFRR